MHGGFFGVEVFFVVSGFLITSLLIDEHDAKRAVSISRSSGSAAPGGCSPALFAVLLVVADLDRLFGIGRAASQLRRDLPWSIFYVANWGQILGDVPYFPGDPPLLRHLWSLAVEEQWYLVWPLVFVALMPDPAAAAHARLIVVGVAGRGRGVQWWIAAWRADAARRSAGGFDGVDRIELPLSLDDHPVGRPAARRRRRVSCGDRGGRRAPTDAPGRPLDSIRSGSPPSACSGAASCVRRADGRYMYPWLLPLVSVAVVVVVMVAVHPAAVGFRRVLTLEAAGRGRQAQLRPLPVALADLRDRGRDPGIGRQASSARWC